MPTDRNLIHQTLKGNPRAFDTLVQKYQSAVYARARFLVRNPQDAEDLTQEVFIKAYQNLPKLRDASRFAGWLSQIAKNVCVTWIHQQKGMSTSCPKDEDPMLNLSSPEATPEQFLIKKELSQTILKAIHSLPATECGGLHMISTLTTSAMTKSQRSAGCRIVPSLAGCIALSIASPRKSSVRSTRSVFSGRIGKHPY